ncbi:MAG TPA: PxKF domain-containing protein [Bryobacteraceae bacterium]|nr:PxKF domain-containing protein [Bryobacteraceae bacterium]
MTLTVFRRFRTTAMMLGLAVGVALSASGSTTPVIVPSTAGPWDAALNPTFDYTHAHDYTAPIVINAASGITFSPGGTVTVSYVSGTVSPGAGYPYFDANGQVGNITNGCVMNSFNGCFPAYYMNPAVPVYSVELVGTFANNGVIVGQPFAIGNGPATLTIPAGANQLQLGINDNSYSDNAGALTVSVSQSYQVCLLYDSTKAIQSGSTIPIKLQLCDASGNDLSSSTITLHGTAVIQISTSISGAVQSAGNANPDSDFRYDPTLGIAGGYVFNLQTKGLQTGTYNLNFTVTGDSFTYAAPFQVK